jgi:hypothetical protein
VGANTESDMQGGYEYLGYYSPADGAKLFQAFDAAGIDYAADVADSTGKMSLALSVMGGSFGGAVQVLISIDPARRADVLRIHQELFGDCLPNYDSSFFKEHRKLEPDDQTPKEKT